MTATTKQIVTDWIALHSKAAHIRIGHDRINKDRCELLKACIQSCGMNVQEKTKFLPPTWNLIFCQHSPTFLQSLSEDGYDGFDAPPADLFKYRVWAGSQYRFNPDNRLRFGGDESVTEKTRFLDAQLKWNARDGQPTVFVKQQKTLETAQGWAVDEVRTLAYRTIPFQPPASFSLAPNSAISNNHDTVIPTNISLFQYSALTHNSHRIHYDYKYAKEKEGFRDLLVHGPLTSTLMLEYARLKLWDQKSHFLLSWDYRALSPLYVNEPIILSGKRMSHDAQKYRLTAQNKQGRVCMQGTAEIMTIEG